MFLPGLLGAAGLWLAAGAASAAVIDYASRFGRTSADRATAIALDTAGNRYIAGTLAAGTGRGTDILLAKLSPAGELLALESFGAAGDDIVHAIAVDALGRIYIAGETDSPNLPPVGSLAPVQGSYGGAGDGFLLILDPGLSVLSYSYLGGSGFDAVQGMTLDASGAIYLVGSTASDDFPGMGPGSLQAERGNDGDATDAFIVKLAPGGESIVYASYLGGNAMDRANAIAVDADGRAVIAGATGSQNFPVTGGVFQPGHGGAATDAFIARLNPAGTALEFSTYLGGGALDGANAVAIGAGGDVYVAGFTSSMEVISPDTNDVAGFPLSDDPAQSINAGGTFDGFVSRLTADGSQLVWSTYLGSADWDEVTAIAVDGEGRATVGGFSISDLGGPRGGGLPLTRALQFGPLGGSDGFIARFAADGALILSTWLGGSGDDSVNAIAVRDGRIHIAGSTSSADFFARGAVLHGVPGDFGEDAFLVEIDADMEEDELPDLRVTISHDPMPVPVNGIAAFDIAVTSDRPGDVSGVMLLLSLSGASIASPVDPACRAVNDSTAVCTIADASGGETVSLRADPHAIGSMRVQASLLRVDQADRVTDNNTAPATLTIVDTSGGRGANGPMTLAFMTFIWLVLRGFGRRYHIQGNTQ
jgi:hypothetical protein